ncbi:Glutamine dumper 2 [Heracleum sosnowskyi]|uniref:Glutamine dumper 2 n=1 Tax=Heracleum sosnowskyi TaxID=360622 RepID=A0AAD8HZS6_9APIA|nr:Glutamine dumper 2 [Heracleum sosnowskyi]
MRPNPSITIHTMSTGTTVVASGVHKWNSPLPYLFGSLALMLTLVALALLILVCSYVKSFTSRSFENDAEDVNFEKAAGYVMELELEPKIVVIMAGDEVPTFLLKKS